MDSLVDGVLSFVKKEADTKRDIKKLDTLAGQYSSSSEPAAARDFKPKMMSGSYAGTTLAERYMHACSHLISVE